MAPKYIIEKHKLYEVDENGEKVLVCSTQSEYRAYLRFTNKTSRSVNVWWRDFRGSRHHYLCLGPGSFSDINTYITHPWEFTDVATNENFVINNCVIFRPPQNLADMMFRTNWNITVSVRTLRFSAMLVIAERLSSPEEVQEFGLPKHLEDDLQKMIRGLSMEERTNDQS